VVSYVYASLRLGDFARSSSSGTLTIGMMPSLISSTWESIGVDDLFGNGIVRHSGLLLFLAKPPRRKEATATPGMVGSSMEIAPDVLSASDVRRHGLTWFFLA
jgi:hypothetical protein